MIFRKLEYTIAEAIVGIRRNGFMGLATVTIIALTLAVFGAFALTAMGANNFALSQINKFQIVAFGSTENESEIEAALDEIKNIDGVKSAQLCDREKEWESFKKQYPNIDVSGVKGVNGNPLPYRIDVKVADSAKTSAEALKKTTTTTPITIRCAITVISTVPVTWAPLSLSACTWALFRFTSSTSTPFFVRYAPSTVPSDPAP